MLNVLFTMKFKQHGNVILSRYVVAHSVGRPLIYPGSTRLLQAGFCK